MSRKTISKKSPSLPFVPPKFTRKTKPLFKKFTNKTAAFCPKSIIFAVCKCYLPVFAFKPLKRCSFCAHFCLFLHTKNQTFHFGKFHLPILRDSKKFTKKGIFPPFCESCTILRAYFLHTRKLRENPSDLCRGADFKSPFPKNKYFDKKRKKRAPRKECPHLSFYFKKPLTMCSSASASVSPKVISLMSCSPAILPMAAS